MSEHISTERMNDLLDGQLPDEAARRVRTHLDGCPVCRNEYALLSEAVEEIRRLPRTASPPQATWDAIEARIHAGQGDAPDDEGGRLVPFPGAELPGETPRPLARRVSLSVGQLAVAAGLVALLSAGVAVQVRGPSVPTWERVAQPLPEGPILGAAARAASTGEPGYEQAVASLELLLAEAGDAMAPETRATVEASLAEIEAALLEVRQALDADPSSDLLRRMLVSHQTAKLRVLRQAASSIDSRS